MIRNWIKKPSDDRPRSSAQIAVNRGYPNHFSKTIDEARRGRESIVVVKSDHKSLSRGGNFTLLEWEWLSESPFSLELVLLLLPRWKSPFVMLRAPSVGARGLMGKTFWSWFIWKRFSFWRPSRSFSSTVGHQNFRQMPTHFTTR